MLRKEARKPPRYEFTSFNKLRTPCCANHRKKTLTVSLNPHLSARCAGNYLQTPKTRTSPNEIVQNSLTKPCRKPLQALSRPYTNRPRASIKTANPTKRARKRLRQSFTPYQSTEHLRCPFLLRQPQKRSFYLSPAVNCQPSYRGVSSKHRGRASSACSKHSKNILKSLRKLL